MDATDHVRDTVGARYTIERELGRGGMGTVYLARDIRLDRPVALKVLPAEFAAMPALRERFLRETRTAAGFSHPNIVPVYAVEEAPGLLAYAMAYIEGESLAERVARAGPLGVRDVVKLLQDTGYALAYAHGRGVVHRDIKPDNIMIERATGRAMVMDFGIARVIAAPAPAGPEGLTRVGEVVGTPEYMSPEQATGDHVDGRSDLYSLGLTAYFAVTGRPAFTGTTTGKVLARQITELLPSIQSVRPELPTPLAEAIDRCVMKDPAERFQTAEELVEALDASRLAATEIPLAIRLFARDVASLGMGLILGTFAALVMLRVGTGGDQRNDDILLPVFLLFSVLLTRVVQTGGEVTRLAASGFSADDILRGMLATVTERAQRRTELRSNQAMRSGRQREFYRGFVQLIVALFAFRIALGFRHPRPQGGYQVDLPGTILVFGSVILLGFSLPTLLRSPFRMPIGERLFRVVWLGPIGRVFVGLSGRREWMRGHAGGASAHRESWLAAPVAAVAVAAPAPADTPVNSLEARVAELERWRRESTAN